MTRKADATKPAARKPAVKRQPEDTRRRILAAAIAEFTEKGLDGSRVDEIAARAGANKRMIYQYFGNKEELWLFALETVYDAMRGDERALDIGKLDPVDGMRKLVEFNFRYSAEHPELIAMLNDENLHRARYLKRSKRVPALHSPLLEMIEGLLRRGVDRGVFRKGVDPMQLYISIAGIGYFYLSNRWTLSTIFGAELESPKALERRLAHIVDVILGYLRA